MDKPDYNQITRAFKKAHQINRGFFYLILGSLSIAAVFLILGNVDTMVFIVAIVLFLMIPIGLFQFIIMITLSIYQKYFTRINSELYIAYWIFVILALLSLFMDFPILFLMFWIPFLISIRFTSALTYLEISDWEKEE